MPKPSGLSYLIEIRNLHKCRPFTLISEARKVTGFTIDLFRYLALIESPWVLWRHLNDEEALERLNWKGFAAFLETLKFETSAADLEPWANIACPFRS